MRFSDKDYHARREREHRAQAEVAKSEKAKLVHVAMAEQHAARVKQCRSIKPSA